MPRKRREPTWLNRITVDAIHHEQIREHGGLPGIRDENALKSALARPQQKWNYDNTADIENLAAAYAFGLVRNHPYRDGNKRIGFLAMATFLGINGVDLVASNAEVVTIFLTLASGNLTEEELSSWIRQHTA